MLQKDANNTESNLEPLPIKDEALRDIGQRIKLARKEINLSQAELGAMLGVSGSYISCLESGKRKLNYKITMPLLRVLRMTYEYLLTGTDCPDEGFLSAVCETSSYHERLRLEKLIQSCSRNEYEMCFELCSAYLQTSRSKKSLNEDIASVTEEKVSKVIQSKSYKYHITEG